MIAAEAGMEHIGWVPWHPRVGYWFTVAERANDREQLTVGWKWVPIYARRPE